MLLAIVGGNEPRLVAAATEQLNKLPFYHSFWNRTTQPSLVTIYVMDFDMNILLFCISEVESEEWQDQALETLSFLFQYCIISFDSHCLTLALKIPSAQHQVYPITRCFYSVIFFLWILLVSHDSGHEYLVNSSVASFNSYLFTRSINFFESFLSINAVFTVFPSLPFLFGNIFPCLFFIHIFSPTLLFNFASINA